MTAPTLTVAQVAPLLGVSESTIYERVRRGEVPNVALGRAVAIPRVWLRDHLAKQGIAGPALIEVIEEGVFT